MANYISADTIRTLREKKGLTQKQLGEQLSVSDKAISKWETGKGLPDITLLEPLAQKLGVSVAELLSGECVVNRNRAGNMQRGSFYVCPLCGNVIYALGKASISCCGVLLPALEAEQAEEADPAHALSLELIENEYYLTLPHPMSKTHSISFLAYVTASRVQILKLYPEQDAAGRFYRCGHGVLYAFCNQHGLFAKRV